MSTILSTKRVGGIHVRFTGEHSRTTPTTVRGGGVDDERQRVVEAGVAPEQVRGVGAEFQLRAGGTADGPDVPADRGRPGEGDGADVGVPYELVTDRFARAGQQLHQPLGQFGQFGVQECPCEGDRGQGVCSADLSITALWVTAFRVLLTSFAVGLVAGGLTALSGAPGAGSVLAGPAAAGSAVPVLRSLIGPPGGACR